jgi:hypothetical protein
MPESYPHDTRDDDLTVNDLRRYLDWETTNLTKATELRLRELGGLVTAFAAGEITPPEAKIRFDHYYKKWPDALPGVWEAQGISDEEILAKVGEGTVRHTAAEDSRRDKARKEGRKFP